MPLKRVASKHRRVIVLVAVLVAAVVVAAVVLFVGRGGSVRHASPPASAGRRPAAPAGRHPVGTAYLQAAYQQAMGRVEAAYAGSLAPFQRVDDRRGSCLDRAMLYPVVRPIAAAAATAATALARIGWPTPASRRDVGTLRSHLGALIAEVDRDDPTTCGAGDSPITPYFTRYVAAFNAVVDADERVRTDLRLRPYARPQLPPTPST